MPYLKRGDSGFEVRLLQKGLAIFGKNPNLSFDGSFGPGTELALKRYQASKGLATTGIYDDPTQRALGPDIAYKFIHYNEMDDFARDMKVMPAALKAVYDVESRGDGFFANGDPVILFEGHIFYKLYQQRYGTTKVREIARRHPNICYPSWDRSKYYGGAREHLRLANAAQVHREIALQSASWGLFQVMGFNYQAAGYDNIQAFINAMYESEHEQFFAGCSFIVSNASMHRALIDRNWREFARRYNGPGYEKNNYHIKLATAFNRHNR